MRCYRGCPNRSKHRFLRCAECLKKQFARQMRSEWWLQKRRLDRDLRRHFDEP